MENNVKQLNGTVLKLLVPECETYLTVLNMRANKGFGIKDLRLIDHVSEVVKAALPPRPEQPRPKPPADGKQFSIEETKANTQLMLDFHKANEELNQKEVELKLSQTDIEILKQKMSGFTSFMGDEVSRKIVLGAAARLGL